MARSGGKYAKGIAKREEILTVALELVGTRGYNAATIRELADAVSLSKTGLLHHFGTKEELFVEILRRRDALDTAEPPEGGALPDYVRRNADVPGFVQMYTRFSAEATEPTHQAHEYFADRYARIRAELTRMMEALQDSGRIAPTASPTALAAAVVAAIDGLQVQWLYDPTVDMPGVLSCLFDALIAPAEVPAAAQ